MRFVDKYPGEIVKALTWKQPFASLMLHGKAETRTLNTQYRGWVLICAGKEPYDLKTLREISGDWQIQRMITKLNSVFPLGGLITAHAIGVGYLSDTKYMWQYQHKEEVEDKTFVKYHETLHVHEYINVQPIEPFHYRGTQGWTVLTDEIKDKIILI